MKTTNRDLLKGIGLLAGFIVILTLLFTPIIEGQKPINYLDNLYNSISKGSVYYIPALAEKSHAYEGRNVSFPLGFLTQQQADKMVHLFGMAGARVEKTDKVLLVNGDLGRIMAVSLVDADLLFKNNGRELTEKYGFGERDALYCWWLGLKAISKQLTREKRFEEAVFVDSVNAKAVECAFNYYGVEPRNISTEVLFVVISLLFYVIYTLWFGFAILYIFSGLGLKLDH